MADFPTGLPDIPNAVGTNPLLTFHTSESHSTSTNRMIANILALATKLGIGSGGPPAAAALLRRTATGQSAWGQAQAGDIVGGGSTNTLLRTTDGTAATWAKLDSNDVDANSLTVDRLSGGGIGNRVIRTAAGSTPVWGQVQTADIAADQVTQVGAKSASASATTTSATHVAIPDDAAGQMSVTLTTVGGALLALFSAVGSNDLTGGVSALSFTLDGTLVPNNDLMAFTAPTNGQYSAHSYSYLWTGVAAGSHTIRATYRVNSGTAHLYGRSISVIELKR